MTSLLVPSAVTACCSFIQEAADAREEVKRLEWEDEVLRIVVDILKPCPDQKSSMNEVINAIHLTVSEGSDGSDSPSAPSRRRVRVVDLKRLLRRAGPHQFVIDESSTWAATHIQLLPTDA